MRDLLDPTRVLSSFDTLSFDTLSDAVANWVVTGIDDPVRRPYVICLGVIFCLGIWLLLHWAEHLDAPRLNPNKIEPTSERGTSWLSRLFSRRAKDTMVLPGMVIDRTSEPHAVWTGPPGIGKTTAVAVHRVNGERPTFIVVPDISDPLREAVEAIGGIICSLTGDGPQGLVRVDVLRGDCHYVARRITDAFRSGGNGAWKRIVRRGVARAIEAMDEDGESRSLVGIARRLLLMRGTEMRAQAVNLWVERFLDVAENFADALAPGGIDVAEELKAGRTILWDCDSFIEQGMLEDVVSLGLIEAKRCAELVPGGFRLIIDEVGQLGDQADLILPFLRAGRRRNISVDVLTQFGPGDLSATMHQLFATSVFFAQEETSAQRAAAARTGREAREFDPRVMGKYRAWVKHGDLLKLVAFPPLDTARLRSRLKLKPVPVGTVPTYDSYNGPAYNGPEVLDVDFWPAEPNYPALPSHRNGVPMLPSGNLRGVGAARADTSSTPRWVKGNKDAERIWSKGINRHCRVPTLDQPCHVWAQKSNNGRGRPKTNIGPKTVTVYKWAWETFNHRNVPEHLGTLDHMCHSYDPSCAGGAECVHELCYEPTHTEPVTLAENGRRQRQQREDHKRWLMAQDLPMDQFEEITT